MIHPVFLMPDSAWTKEILHLIIKWVQKGNTKKTTKEIGLFFHPLFCLSPFGKIPSHICPQFPYF
jgi:hypothetical protein